mmetsp:Transcript_10251/g.13365  ORF Transcript_10251/g.13365 Transcript_10251/m.13365 type:complete len:205 (-) Transcript_10251:578-1192(-)
MFHNLILQFSRIWKLHTSPSMRDKQDFAPLWQGFHCKMPAILFTAVIVRHFVCHQEMISFDHQDVVQTKFLHHRLAFSDEFINANPFRRARPFITWEPKFVKHMRKVLFFVPCQKSSSNLGCSVPIVVTGFWICTFFNEHFHHIVKAIASSKMELIIPIPAWNTKCCSFLDQKLSNFNQTTFARSSNTIKTSAILDIKIVSCSK